MLAALLLVGSLWLHPCSDGPGYWCGTLARPIDPSGEVSGTISIAFTWLPHARANSLSQGTIVAAEGGPGYPSGASRDAYRALFGPVLQTHDLLMMDNRGTGRSNAIDCPQLQHGTISLPAIAGCGASLGDTSDLYGSALAADDLSALLEALHVDRAALYGDSYGTFFVQVFAARHRSQVGAVVLDGAYPAIGGDPWYPSTAPAIRDAFDRVCRRSTACASLPGSALERIERLLRTLRGPGTPITPAQLAFMMDTAGLDALVYRELDAAARAYLDRGDALPLRRLAREADVYEEQPPSDPSVLSNGLFVGASCSDNPQAYDMRLAPDARAVAWRTALDSKRQSDPSLYAPFTVDEFLSIPLDYAYVPLCQNWPVATAAHPAGQPVPAGTSMPDVPALVLTGDLDTITTPAEGDAAARLFTHPRRVIVANVGHVTAIGDVYGCASLIVRAFVTRRPIDDACAQNIPPVRLLPAFARSIGQVAPAIAIGRPQSNGDLRRAADAVWTAGDALARATVLGATGGDGLRGGTFTAATQGERTLVRLHGLRWTDDLAVDGTVGFDQGGHAAARLEWPGTQLRAVWDAYVPAARATIAGRIDGRAVRATMPAP